MARSSTPAALSVTPSEDTTLKATDKLPRGTLEDGMISSTLWVLSFAGSKPRSEPCEVVVRLPAIPLVVSSSTVAAPPVGSSSNSMVSSFTLTRNLSPTAQSSIWYREKVTFTVCNMSPGPKLGIG